MVAHPETRPRDAEKGSAPAPPRKEPIGQVFINEKGQAIPAGGVAPRQSILPKKARGKDLHKNYLVRAELAMILALLVLTGLFRLPISADQDAMVIALAVQETIQMEEIQQTAQEQKPPPPPRPATPIAVADDVLLEDIPLDLDATLDLDEAIAELPPPPPVPEPEAEEVVEDEPEVFMVVEDMPQLIGGIEALHREIDYPEIARQAGVQGRVIVQFVVDENGNVLNPIVLRGIGAGCDEEAIRAIQQMKFIPGKQRGVPVRVQYSVPVTFRLKGVS